MRSKAFRDAMSGRWWLVFGGVLFAVCLVGVISLLAIWVSAGVAIVALLVLSLAGGFVLGKTGVLVAPSVLLVFAISAELRSSHPLDKQSFLIGGGLLLGLVWLAALAGAKTRRRNREVAPGASPGIGE
jgi:hypothetical protein